MVENREINKFSRRRVQRTAPPSHSAGPQNNFKKTLNTALKLMSTDMP